MPTRPPLPISRPTLTVIVTLETGSEPILARYDAPSLAWMMDANSPTGWSLVFPCSGALTVINSHLVQAITVEGGNAGEQGATWCGACDQPLQSFPVIPTDDL